MEIAFVVWVAISRDRPYSGPFGKQRPGKPTYSAELVVDVTSPVAGRFILRPPSAAMYHSEGECREAARVWFAEWLAKCPFGERVDVLGV